MRWQAGLLSALVLMVSSARADAMLLSPPPTPEEMMTPAGVREYRAATAVALVRPKAAFTPPCLFIRLATHFGWLGERPDDVCTRWDRSQRYAFTVLEPLKGAPAPKIQALLGYYGYPLDRKFMSDQLSEEWANAFWTDLLRAKTRHAGFGFLHNGALADHEVWVRQNSKGVINLHGGVRRRAVIDPGLDYLVFIDADGRVEHWEPVLRSAADQDLLVQRLRRLKAGLTVERPLIAAADLFGRFMDAAIYEEVDCRPRLPMGQKISSLDEQAFKLFGLPAVGPTHCRPRLSDGTAIFPLSPPPPSSCLGRRPETRVTHYLLLAPETGVVEVSSIDFDRPPDLRVMPIVDGKVCPADLVSQVQLASETPIPVEQVLAWVRSGRKSYPDIDWAWTRTLSNDPPLRLLKARLPG